MSVVPLHPVSNAKAIDQEEFEREVAARFGLVPNFFRSAPEAPFVIRELWTFAKSAYLDNPIPSLFKERLFVYLSRFCEVRYCITRHCGFLLGLGRASGDPDAPAMTVGQVIRLLQRPVPAEDQSDAALARLETLAEPIDWPSPETPRDDDLRSILRYVALSAAVARGASETRAAYRSWRRKLRIAGCISDLHPGGALLDVNAPGHSPGRRRKGAAVRA